MKNINDYNFECECCGKKMNYLIDRKPWFVVKKELWSKYYPTKKGMICKECFEKEKLHRELVLEDLAPVMMNDHIVLDWIINGKITETEYHKFQHDKYNRFIKIFKNERNIKRHSETCSEG